MEMLGHSPYFVYSTGLWLRQARHPPWASRLTGAYAGVQFMR